MVVGSILAYSPLYRLYNKMKNSFNQRYTSVNEEKLKFVEEIEKDQQSENIRRSYQPINKHRRKLSLNDPRMFSKSIDMLPPPVVILFPPNQLHYEWSMLRVVGPGFYNSQNTCFMNSVLQVLSHTPPLWQYLVYQISHKSCKSNGFCSFCSLSKVFIEMHANHKIPMYPSKLIQNIRLIGSNLIAGRQEDAHEFLISLLSSFKTHFKYQLKGLDRYSKETHFVHHIFGGWIRSTLTCDECSHQSITFDPIIDINLDIEKCDDLQTALKIYFSSEQISGHQYKCSNCNKFVNSHKRVKFERLPRYLIIHLKRFYMDGLRCYKNTKRLRTREILDVSSCVDIADNRPIEYNLYGLVVHHGYTCNSGHYVAYAKTRLNMWFKYNDSQVDTVGLKEVLSQESYLLFYKLHHFKDSQVGFQTYMNNNTSSFHSSQRSKSFSEFDLQPHVFPTQPVSLNEIYSHSKPTNDFRHSSQYIEPKKISSQIPVIRWDSKQSRSDTNSLPTLPHVQTSIHVDKNNNCLFDRENNRDWKYNDKNKSTSMNSKPFDEYDRGKVRKSRTRNNFQNNVFRQNPFQLAHNHTDSSFKNLKKYKISQSNPY